RVHPESGTAVVLLTNGPSKPLFIEIASSVFAEVAGVSMPEPIEPGYEGAQSELLAGQYRGDGTTMEVAVSGDVVQATWWALGSEKPSEADLEWHPLQPAGEGVFV